MPEIAFSEAELVLLSFISFFCLHAFYNRYRFNGVYYENIQISCFISL